MATKLQAEIDILTGHLYDWHAGRITERDFNWRAGSCANQAEIDRLKAIGKHSYRDRDALRELVAVAYLSRP